MKTPKQKAMEYMIEFGTEKSIDIVETMIDVAKYYRNKEIIKYFEEVKEIITQSMQTGNS